MCVRPPCPNCEEMYDACMAECPKCGHPNDRAPLLFEEASAYDMVVEHKKVYCKICKRDHTVTKWKMVKKGE